MRTKTFFFIMIAHKLRKIQQEIARNTGLISSNGIIDHPSLSRQPKAKDLPNAINRPMDGSLGQVQPENVASGRYAR